MLQYLLISCHPYEGSFNAALIQSLQQTLTRQQHQVQHIDLVQDGFDPVMRAEDLKLWSKGETQDPLVRQYQAAINKDNLIVFAFPVWWGTMPAVLKGFCDKVLLPGWAYRHGETGEMIGLLTTKKAIVISTMETPADVFKSYYNDPVEGAFLKDTLQTCGIKVLHHFQIDRIISGGRAYTDAKLHEITQFIESDEILLV